MNDELSDRENDDPKRQIIFDKFFDEFCDDCFEYTYLY